MKHLYRFFFAAVLLGVMLLPPLPAQAGSYTVAPGDSLFSISVQHGTTVHNLMEINQLTSTLIRPGQQLNVPHGKDILEPAARGYVVVPGDTLYQIALRFGTSTQAIMIANNLSGTVIHPTQVLVMPRMYEVPSRAVPEKRIPYTDEELDLLARLITAEARGESNVGKVGVGAVVINRVLSPQFPNTIREVIYQPRQFGPAQTGKINNPAHDCCVIAAQEALRGIDPTDGALFFFDTGTRSSYLRSLPVAFTNGNLIFSHPR